MEKQDVEWKEYWRDEYLKWICGFANGKGGKLYIGIDDYGRVVGVEDVKKILVDLPNKIRNAIGIVVQVNVKCEDMKEYIEIDVSPHPFPVSCKGKYYLRSGSTMQLLSGPTLDEFMLRKQGVKWDHVPVLNVSMNNLSNLAIKQFLELAIKKGRLSQDIQIEEKEILIDKLNLTQGEYITNAAILLFHENPERYIPGSFIKIGFFESDAEIIYQDEVHGSILQQVDKAMDLLYFKYLKAKISYEGLQRIERYPFPYDAVREALLNAIVHKDYTSGIPIQISVYDDKLYISNDARLPENWTIQDLLGKHRSQPYNPSIAHVFYLAGFIESWGRGIEKICSACKLDGIYEPRFIVHPRDFMIRFAAPEERVIWSGKRVLSVHEGHDSNYDSNDSNLTETEYRVYRELCMSPKISAQKIERLTGLSIATVNRAFKSLKEKGYIKRLGTTRGEWIILK